MANFNESDIKCAIQTVLSDKQSEVDTWSGMWDIMEGECIGFYESLLKLLDALHIQYSEDEFKKLI